jgi:hypothetical protein
MLHCLYNAIAIHRVVVHFRTTLLYLSWLKLSDCCYWRWGIKEQNN